MFLKTQQDVLYKIMKVHVLWNKNTFLEAQNILTGLIRSLIHKYHKQS